MARFSFIDLKGDSWLVIHHSSPPYLSLYLSLGYGDYVVPITRIYGIFISIFK